jgi:hypothetical protein
MTVLLNLLYVTVQLLASGKFPSATSATTIGMLNADAHTNANANTNANADVQC